MARAPAGARGPLRYNNPMAVIDVILDIPSKAFDGAFSYYVGPNLEPDVEVGCAVLVTFNRREEVAFVMAKRDGGEGDSQYSGVKEVLSEPYFDERTAELMLWIAHKYIAPLPAAIRLALPFAGTPKFVRHKDGTRTLVKASRRPKNCEFKAEEVAACSGNYKRPEKLTDEQEHALFIIENSAPGACVLIDGVTGSGKTEIYLQAIENAIAKGKTAIVLVPEIALTPQTVARFESRFPGEIAVMHSKMKPSERRQQWFWIKDGNAKVVVGPRSALFAPLKNVGIVVIDEEHETTYKQELAPRYHARDVAAKKMELEGGVLIEGDATPSIDVLYLAKHDPNWTRVELTRRATGMKMPKVEVVNMSDLPNGGKNSLFSEHLKKAILEELAAKHKVVLLLNQRGFSRFLLCKECGFVPECPNCASSLTFHEAGNMLKCHHCGYEVASPARCPNCGSPYLGRIGYGTQRVEAELRAFISEAEFNRAQSLGSCSGIEQDPRDCARSAHPTIVRMDADTTAEAHSHEKLLREFDEAEAAVLLGTQMIAKGLDFEEVTLVGVINADTTMHVPDFRAAERTYDLIEQVSGRCGRSKLPGKVIVQTYEPDNAAIRAAMAHDREMFLRVELPKRSVLKFPPYVSMINVLVWSNVKEEAQMEAARIADELRDLLKDYDVKIAGANPCPFEKLQRSWRFHILLKFKDQDIEPLLENYFRKHRSKYSANVAVDVDPISVL